MARRALERVLRYATHCHRCGGPMPIGTAYVLYKTRVIHRGCAPGADDT